MDKLTSGRYPERAEKNILYRVCYIVATHFIFTLLITVLIVLNTIVLAFDQYPEKEELNDVATVLNDIFTYCFILEMVIKLLGLGFKEYAKDSFNIFDATIVIVSILDIILDKA